MGRIDEIYFLDNNKFSNLTDQKDIDKVNKVRRILKEIEPEILIEGGLIQIDSDSGKIIPTRLSLGVIEKISELLSS